MKQSKDRFKHWHVGSDYKCEKAIGQGSYGQVCRAKHIPTGKDVAIKRIPKLFTNLGDTIRILRELTILTKLRSVGVSKLLDLIFEHEDLENFDTVYVVMELSQTDLAKLSGTKMYMTMKQVTAVMYNLLKSVQYMHSCGIVHRDLKPANILLFEDCSIQIADFGLARTTRNIDNSLGNFVNRKLIKEQMASDKSTVKLKKKNQAHTGDERYLDDELAFEEEYKSSMESLKKQQLQPKQDLKDLLIQQIKKTEPQRVKLPRQMSWYVGTRCYRPPEIVLLYPSYGKEYDMWSVGCIFAELLEMVKENQPDYHERGGLFNPSSCYPMSPSANLKANSDDHPNLSSGDQLNQILSVTGFPSRRDASFLCDQKALLYLKSVVKDKKVKEINLDQKYPGSPPEAVKLLKKLLEFNPIFRLTAEEAMQSPLFAKQFYSEEDVCDEKPAIKIKIDEETNKEELTKDLVRGHFIELYLNYTQQRT